MKLQTLLMGAALLFVATACSKDEPEPKPNPKPGTDPEAPAEVKQITFSATEYGTWTYIDLKSGKTETLGVKGPWVYKQQNNEGQMEEVYTKDMAENTEEPKELKEWQLAFHRFEPKTNMGEVVETTETELSKVTEVPTSGFEADKEIKEKIIVDAKNMMMGNIGYAKTAFVNLTLYKWLKRTPTGGMPPYDYSLSGKVYVLKCKDGQYYKLKFTDYMNKEGQKGVITFSYSPIKMKK